MGAHSTARALYAAYTGNLYQVQRASDMSTKDIPVGADGFVDSSVQDSFCSGTTCTIPVIYDQTPNGNHLRVTWFANWLRSGASPADASKGQITVGGHTVHGIYVGGSGGSNVGYRTGTQLPGTAAVTNGSTNVTFSMPQTLAKGTPLFFGTASNDCMTYMCPLYYVAADVTNSTTVTLTTGPAIFTSGAGSDGSYSGTSNSATVAWNEGTKGVATGDASEAMYSVWDGTRSNSSCCFDYGNSEQNGIDDGAATMEALYWGGDSQFGQSGGGSGPWLGADLENGMYEGWSSTPQMCTTDLPASYAFSSFTAVQGGWTGQGCVPSNTSITGFPFVTVMLKGPSASDCPASMQSTGCFALKAGNATSGTLSFQFDADAKGYGPRPPGYSPQNKGGAIILGTGGDGSSGSIGTWYEGAITMGTPADATDDAVQANIVAAGYGH